MMFFHCFAKTLGASLLYTAISLTIAITANAEKRVALVVGNSAYRNVPPLTNPVNDAKLIAETLQSRGFELVGGGAQLDLDKPGFEAIVKRFGTLVQGADVGLFYYAGHGVQVREANYLVPVSANPEREADADFEMLDTALVMRQMEGAGTRLNLIILDACRNNPFGGRALRGNDRGLAQMIAPEGTLISFATQPGNVAMDGEEGNSPYTKALAQTVKRTGLGLFDVFNQVGLEVKKQTGGSQQPWVSSSPISGSFYFSGSPGTQPSSPAIEPAPAERPNEAQQVWATVQNTTSIAVIERFIEQFPGSRYADIARARLEELKKSQISAVSMLRHAASPVISGDDHTELAVVPWHDAYAVHTESSRLQQFASFYCRGPTRRRLLAITLSHGSTPKPFNDGANVERIVRVSDFRVENADGRFTLLRPQKRYVRTYVDRGENKTDVVFEWEEADWLILQASTRFGAHGRRADDDRRVADRLEVRISGDRRLFDQVARTCMK